MLRCRKPVPEESLLGVCGSGENVIAWPRNGNEGWDAAWPAIALRRAVATDKPAAIEASALVHLLRDRAAREPRQVALRVKRLGLWQETTWADLATRVRNLALGLATLGVKAGDAVAIIAA